MTRLKTATLATIVGLSSLTSSQLDAEPIYPNPPATQSTTVPSPTPNEYFGVEPKVDYNNGRMSPLAVTVAGILAVGTIASTLYISSRVERWSKYKSN